MIGRPNNNEHQEWFQYTHCRILTNQCFPGKVHFEVCRSHLRLKRARRTTVVNISQSILLNIFDGAGAHQLMINADL